MTIKFRDPIYRWHDEGRDHQLVRTEEGYKLFSGGETMSATNPGKMHLLGKLVHHMLVERLAPVAPIYKRSKEPDLRGLVDGCWLSTVQAREFIRTNRCRPHIDIQSESGYSGPGVWMMHPEVVFALKKCDLPVTLMPYDINGRYTLFDMLVEENERHKLKLEILLRGSGKVTIEPFDPDSWWWE